MSDEDKTKELLDEISRMRQRISMLEVIEKEHRLTEKQLKQRVEIEEALALASRLFISIDEPDLNQILKIFGEVVKANRSYIFLIREDGEKVDNTHEWCDSSTEPQIHNLQGLDSARFPWWMEKLKRRENIVISDVSALPLEANAEKEIVQSQGVRSLLVVPIDATEERLLGFMGFIDTEKCRTWSEEDIRLLRVASEMISGYLKRKRTEEALRISKEKYRTVFETTGTATVIVEEDVISLANTEFEKLSGYAKEEVEGRKRWTEFIVEEDLEKMKEYYRLFRLDPSAVPVNYEFRARDRNGNVKDIFMKIARVKDTKKIVVSLLDITELKRAEGQCRISLREKEILLRELYHRTKNNLQVISSLLNLQALAIDDKQMLGVVQDIQNRIRSISLVHEKLYQSKDLSNINLRDYVRELTHALLRSYEGSKSRISFALDINDAIITLDTITTCGLIINELVSNSLKYAFPDSKEGEIRIALHAMDGNEIELRISDNGIGLPESVDFQNAQTLGLKLVRRLVEDQLMGRIEVKGEKRTDFVVTFKEMARYDRNVRLW